MRELIAGTGAALWVVLVLVVVFLGIAVLGVETQGWFLTKQAENTRHALNFTQGANQRAEGYISDYAAADSAGDQEHAAALASQACSAALSISPSERYPDVQQWAAVHCGTR